MWLVRVARRPNAVCYDVMSNLVLASCPSDPSCAQRRLRPSPHQELMNSKIHDACGYSTIPDQLTVSNGNGQSPVPGSGLKCASLPLTPFHWSASAGDSFFRVMFGQISA
jgi:hypothetical protein